MNISDYNFVDFSDAFEDSGIRKRLLTQMGLFQPYGHSSPNFSFDINLGNDQNNADPVMRHGSEWDYTVRSLAKLQNMELPHWAFQDAVRPAMWQGKRRPGSAEQMTAEDVIADLGMHQRLKQGRIQEKYFADCLFHNNVNAKYTQEEQVDNQVIVGKNQQTMNIDLGDATSDPDTFVMKVQRTIKKELGDRADFLTKIVCFASPDYFDAFRSHPKVREVILNGGVDGAVVEHVMGSYGAVLAAYQMFVYGGVLFICDDYADHGIVNNTAYYVPVLGSQSKVYTKHYGPAARQFELANQGPQEVFSYIVKDKYNMVDACTEFSMLPINLMPNAVVKSTNA